MAYYYVGWAVLAGACSYTGARYLGLHWFWAVTSGAPLAGSLVLMLHFAITSRAWASLAGVYLAADPARDLLLERLKECTPCPWSEVESGHDPWEGEAVGACMLLLPPALVVWWLLGGGVAKFLAAVIVPLLIGVVIAGLIGRPSWLARQELHRRWMERVLPGAATQARPAPEPFADPELATAARALLQEAQRLTSRIAVHDRLGAQRIGQTVAALQLAVSQNDMHLTSMAARDLVQQCLDAEFAALLDQADVDGVKALAQKVCDLAER